MASEYLLADVLERIYHNQLALEAAVMELTAWAEQQNAVDVGNNVRGRFTPLAKTQVISNKACPG